MLPLDDQQSVSSVGDEMTVAPFQPAPGVIVVRLQGELDMLTAPRCGRVLRLAVRGVAQELARSHEPLRSGPGRVVCDLDGVDFLAAAALAMLLQVADEADARGVELVLVAARRPVRRVLGLTGLDGHFAMMERWETAVQGAGTARVAS